MNTVGFLCTLGLMAAFGCLVDGGNTDKCDGIIDLSDDEKNKIIEKHNNLRSHVQPSATNMLQMKWNEDSAQNAKAFAKKCQNKHSGTEARKVNGVTCGENIFYATHRVNLTNAVQAWYNEVRDFNRTITQNMTKEEKAELLQLVGHFTQVIWHNSKDLGCAVVCCPNINSTFRYRLVCHYCPAGNSDIANPYETGKPCEKCPNNCENNLCTWDPCPYLDIASNCKKWTRFCYHKIFKMFCSKTCICGDKK